MATQPNSQLPYDPLAAQPLDSGSASGADSAAAAGPQLPPITAPPKAPPTDTSVANAGSGPRLLPGAKGTNLGVAAYLGESLLKGITQGREQYQAQQAYKAKRLSDGLQYAYQTAADNYTSLIKSGADPKSPDVQKADLAQRAAYQSLMQMRGNFIMGNDSGKKSKKSKGGDQGAGEDPMQMFMSADPKTKMKGAFLLQQRMFQNVGTPANANARQYLTPEYQAQRKLMQSQQTLTQANVDDKLALRDLEMTDISKMTDAEKSAHAQKLQSLRDRVGEAASGYKQTEKIIQKKITPDNHQWAQYQSADGKTDWRDEGEVRAPVSQTKPVRGWSMKNGKPVSVEIDPKTNQIIPGTENASIAPPAGMLEHVRTGEFSWTDADGNLHRTQTTTTSKPVVPGSGGGSAASSSSTSTPAKPGTGPLGVQPPPSGDRIIGNKGATGQAKSRAEAADSVLQLLPKAQEMLKDPEVRANVGALSGRWSEVEKKAGTLDPKTQEFYGTLKSIYALNGSMHGWRSLKAPEEFEKAYGDLHTDPDTLLGGLRAVEDTAKDVYQTGYHHPYGQTASGATNKPVGSGAGDPATAETPEQKQLLDKYFPPVK